MSRKNEKDVGGKGVAFYISPTESGERKAFWPHLKIWYKEKRYGD
jgi:hypothetical protein